MVSAVFEELFIHLLFNPLQGIILTLSSPSLAVFLFRRTWRELIMGIVKGNWLTGAHSGRACRHQSVYTRVNKKTGACYSAQLCNPNPYRNETQKKTTSAFGLVSAAVTAWIAAEKAKGTLSEDYTKVKMAYDRQTRYSSLRGFMFAKGMYKYENGQVVVDVNANTAFTTVSAAIKLDTPAQSPAAPGGSDAGGSGSGSQTPSQGGSGSDSGSAGSGDDQFTEAPE